jgi:hypothetical protein
MVKNEKIEKKRFDKKRKVEKVKKLEKRMKLETENINQLKH